MSYFRDLLIFAPILAIREKTIAKNSSVGGTERFAKIGIQRYTLVVGIG